MSTLVSHLVAAISPPSSNLLTDTGPIGSPRSAISRIDHAHQRERAEHVLEMLVSLLSSSPPLLQKFAAAVPFTRICLLLLGDHPSPTAATEVLKLIRISVDSSQTFVRKFELVSGWVILKNVLPYAWTREVHQVVFDILLDYRGEDKTIVRCPNIMPAIITSLHHGLQSSATDLSAVLDTLSIEGRSVPFSSFPCVKLLFVGSTPSAIAGADLEALLEILIQLHSTSPSFKQIFKSTQITQQFIGTHLAFVSAVKDLPEISQRVTSLMDKMCHFAVALALDPSLSETQQAEVIGFF